MRINSNLKPSSLGPAAPSGDCVRLATIAIRLRPSLSSTLVDTFTTHLSLHHINRECYCLYSCSFQ